MRRDQSSLTAAGIAAARAVESEKPEGERICYDPYARLFTPAWLFRLVEIFIRNGYTERRGPGVIGYLVARERFFDDILKESLQHGLQQLVILGAGYDSRAYRYDLQQKGVSTFEVDHPATQKVKLNRVSRIFQVTPAHVTYVPVDFNTQVLETRLLEHGYQSGKKTLFLWQGVSMYLTPEAVDTTLAFVSNFSAPGSMIIFDYIQREVLEDNQKRGEIAGMHKHRFMTGENLVFGIKQGTMEAFIKEHGLKMIRNVDEKYLMEAYFTGKNSERNITSGYGIVVAET